MEGARRRSRRCAKLVVLAESMEAALQLVRESFPPEEHGRFECSYFIDACPSGVTVVSQ